MRRARRYDRALKEDVATVAWRISLLSFASAWFFYYFLHVALQTWQVPLWLSLPAGVVVVLAIAAGIEGHAVGVAQRHAARVRPVRPVRRIRIAVPQDRQAPVAIQDCTRCSAVKGRRHERDCPTIPTAWFNNPREGGASQR